MKKLIIGMLILTSCGQELIHTGHSVYMVRPFFGYSIACEIAQRTSCGYTLSVCDNGHTYFCVNNVEMAQIK